MSMLAAFFGALARALDDITANWADITFASPTSSGTNSNVTVTFTAGSPRTLLIDYIAGLGALESRINSGSYDSCSAGTEIALTSGQTLHFRYTAAGVNESFTVTVRDKTDANRTIDTFDVSVSGY